MGRPVNANGERTRQAILDAGLQTFAEKGYFGSSLRDIATLVGVRESALYNYFNSKEALFHAILDAAAQAVEIAAQEDNVGALSRNIHGLLNRDADIGRMQGRCVIDAVAEISDRVPGLLQGADDPLFLLGIDLNKKISAWREVP